MRKVAILGSTGSIGQNTLKVIDSLGEGYTVAALGAGRSISVLAGQIRKYRPSLVSVADPDDANALRELLEPPYPEILHGTEGLCSVATESGACTVVSAVVGAAGLIPTLRALERGLRVALANKETLVIAGELMTAAATSSGAELLPVDSEHNALHQCLRGAAREDVRRVVLTASGGPFRLHSASELEKVSIAEALAHPTWRMGDKITIDSATLMNKGLEVIEAHWLFGMSASEIDVVVHPQSVVHSMVELVDGSIISQMGVTDMRHAIQYALTFPKRLDSPCGFLDLTAVGRLEFYEPDTKLFPALRLAYEALDAGGTHPAVLNGANEEAVAAFLAGHIGLLDIPRVVEEVLSCHDGGPADSLQSVLEADSAARVEARARLAKTVLS